MYRERLRMNRVAPPCKVYSGRMICRLPETPSIGETEMIAQNFKLLVSNFDFSTLILYHHNSKKCEFHEIPLIIMMLSVVKITPTRNVKVNVFPIQCCLLSGF